MGAHKFIYEWSQIRLGSSHLVARRYASLFLTASVYVIYRHMAGFALPSLAWHIALCRNLSTPCRAELLHRPCPWRYINYGKHSLPLFSGVLIGRMCIAHPVHVELDVKRSTGVVFI